MTGEEKDVQKGGSMPRAPSVDDLFVPMGRLDMHSSGMGADNEEVKEGGNTSASNVCGSSSLVHSATAEKTPSASDGARLGLNLNRSELSGLSRDSCGEISEQVHDKGGETHSSPRNKKPEGQSNHTSDDDQPVIDERRQKRMISNRESARRSRLRKQQHLDELRSQISHLRAENVHLLNRYSLASQQYAQLNEENSVLRSNAVDLRHQLQTLHPGTSGHQMMTLEPRDLSSVQPLPLNLSLCSGPIEDPNWGKY